MSGGKCWAPAVVVSLAWEVLCDQGGGQETVVQTSLSMRISDFVLLEIPGVSLCHPQVVILMLRSLLLTFLTML